LTCSCLTIRLPPDTSSMGSSSRRSCASKYRREVSAVAVGNPGPDLSELSARAVARARQRLELAVDPGLRHGESHDLLSLDGDQRRADRHA